MIRLRVFLGTAFALAAILGAFVRAQSTDPEKKKKAREEIGARAAELLLTGRLLSAREALEFGLVSRVVPDPELLSTARALATEIARDTAPVSVAITKWLLWGMQREIDLARADDLDARAFWWTGRQPDAAEGVRAFLEKRPARWSMRPSQDMPDFLPPPGRARS